MLNNVAVFSNNDRHTNDEEYNVLWVAVSSPEIVHESLWRHEENAFLLPLIFIISSVRTGY